jgi:hypothetical protein
MISTWAGSSRVRTSGSAASADRARDRRCRRVAASLRQPQQRQARLRLGAVPARLAVRPLGGGVVALQPVQLALPVARLPDGARVGAAVAGPAGLVERLAPGPARLHDLGAVDEAAAREHHDPGLLLDPARHRRRPLLRARQLVQLPAAVDHAAVDEAGRDRRHLAGDDGHHRLVEQRQALLGGAQPDEAQALLVDGEREEVRVAEAPPDLGALGRAGTAGLRIA